MEEVKVHFIDNTTSKTIHEDVMNHQPKVKEVISIIQNSTIRNYTVTRVALSSDGSFLRVYLKPRN